MVISRAATTGGIFEPSDLKILQRVFDQSCIDRGYAQDSEEAKELAAVIVDLFHAGFASEAQLSEAVARKSDSGSGFKNSTGCWSRQIPFAACDRHPEPARIPFFLIVLVAARLACSNSRLVVVPHFRNQQPQRPAPSTKTRPIVSLSSSRRSWKPLGRAFPDRCRIFNEALRTLDRNIVTSGEIFDFVVLFAGYAQTVTIVLFRLVVSHFDILLAITTAQPRGWFLNFRRTSEPIH